MLKRIFSVATAAFLIVFMHSCYKDRFDPLPNGIALNPNIAIPVASVNLNIEHSQIIFDFTDFVIDSLISVLMDHDTIYFIDTLGFNINDITKDAEMIRFLEFNLLTWNDFPSTANVQVYFIDSLGIKQDSLFSPKPLVINPGSINSEGSVTSRGYSVASNYIFQDNVDNVASASHIVLNCKVVNDDIENIVYFEHYTKYFLTVKLSARVGFDITID